MAEITGYTSTAGDINPDSRNIMADLLEEFSKTYKDAGNIIGQALVVFLKLK